MKTPLLTLFTVIACTISSALAGPEAGRYTGLVTITKTVNDLSHAYSLRAEASVAANGEVTILSTVPESPSAAINVDNSVTVAKPYVPPSLGVVGTGTNTITSAVVTGTTLFPVGVYIGTDPLPAIHDPFAGHNYVIDDTLPANLVVTGKRFTISYVSTALNSTTAFPKRTSFEFRFLKTR